MLHLDIKKLGRFWQPGHCVTGDRQRASDGASWDFGHMAVDDAFRVAQSCVLPDERGTRACIAPAVQPSPLSGAGRALHPRHDRQRGACYRSRSFRRILRRLGLRHVRTRPHTSRSNGKAERFIQPALREWAYDRRYEHSDQRTACLPHRLHHYNHHRRHASLNYQPSMSCISGMNKVLDLHN